MKTNLSIVYQLGQSQSQIRLNFPNLLTSLDVHPHIKVNLNLSFGEAPYDEKVVLHQIDSWRHIMESYRHRYYSNFISQLTTFYFRKNQFLVYQTGPFTLQH